MGNTIHMDDICESTMVDGIVEQIGFPADLREYEARYKEAVRKSAAVLLGSSEDSEDCVITFGEMLEFVTHYSLGYADCLRDSIKAGQ